MNLNNHYDCPLETIGLSASSTDEEVEAAVAREMEDLENNYGAGHGVSEDELRDHLIAWVAREAKKLLPAAESEIRCATITAIGIGSGSRPADTYEVAYRYREVERGVLQPVLIDGSPWAIDGEPAPARKILPHWKAEVFLRLPDEEHGYEWTHPGGGMVQE